jgi:VanZ family protein
MSWIRRIFFWPGFWLVLLLVWAGVLWWVSGRSMPGGLPGIPHIDKVYHAGYFTLGGVAIHRLLMAGWPGLNAGRAVLLCVLLAAGIGVLDEYHQSFTPGRSGNDLGDMLADALGGLLGGLLSIGVARWLGGQDTNEMLEREG